MAQKKVAWKDDSGDNITLTADAWSGTQQVTVQTPENFGKYRALNIVFYSVADATKSATLKVTQEAATATLSPNTVIFDNTETAAKTITLSTNISTLSSTSIALEGADASQFTLSALSALSNGKATFTIKPNSVNQGTSSRNCSIKVTVGRLDVMNIPVEQLADAVVKTEYLNYYLDGGVFTYNGNSIGTGAVVDILASLGTLNIQGQVRRTKKVTYASGRVETTQENVPAGNTIYYVVEIKDVGGFSRSKHVGSDAASSFLSGVDFDVKSLGFSLYDGDDGELYVTLSDKSISTSEFSVANDLSIKKNIRTGYSNYSNKNFPSRTVAAAGGSVACFASAYGTCTYSSGASRTENVPMKFEFVGPVSWASITSQTPGAAGTSLAASRCSINASANTSTTSSRNLSVSALPRLADGSTGGTEVGLITVTQSAATPVYNYRCNFNNQLRAGTVYFFSTYPISGSPALSLTNGQSGGLSVTTAEMVIQFPSASSSYTAILKNPNNSTLISYYVPASGNQQKISNEIVQALHIIAIAGQWCTITK